MRKNAIKIVLIVLVAFCFNLISVEALANCNYEFEHTYKDGKRNTDSSFLGGNTKLKLHIYGEKTKGEAESYTYFGGEEDDPAIDNWTSTFDDSGYSVPQFPRNKLDSSGCPEYVGVFDNWIGKVYWIAIPGDSVSKYEKIVVDDMGYTDIYILKKIEKSEARVDEEEKPGIGSCSGLDEHTCKTNTSFACVWNETKYGGYCNTDNLTYVQCGDAFDIPSKLPPIINFAVNLLKIVTPIVLIIVGMITLIKALAASKEDEITKAKNSLIKKVIAAVIVFFVIAIVQFVISLVAEDESEANNFSNCLSCFLNNDCKSTTYYKTNIAGQYWCTYFETGEMKRCQGDNK